MRKIIISLLLFALLAFTIVMIVQGITFQKMELYGIKQIKQKDEEINQKNEKLTNLVTKDYPAEMALLKTSSQTLKNTKEEYLEKMNLLRDGKHDMQTETYQEEFLWVKFGNYALDRDVEIKIDVTNGQLSGRYNLNFEVAGKYIDVTEYISDIESDSSLGFKIDDFSMTAGATVTTTVIDEEGNEVEKTISEGVIGKFSCKDIKINLSTISSTPNTQITNSTNTESTTNTSNNTSNIEENTNTEDEPEEIPEEE